MSEEILYPNSSNVKALEYFDQTDDASAKLVVTFPGSRYSYSGVPEEIWAELKHQGTIGSIGKAFHALIRTAGYPYARLDDDADAEEGAETPRPARRQFARRTPPSAPPAASGGRTDQPKRSAADRRRTHR